MRICSACFLLLLFFGSGHAVFAQESALTGQSTTDAQFDDAFSDDFSDEADDVLIADPLESYNRGVFWFNDKLYVYVLKPVVNVYRVVPRPVRSSVGNFFANLSSPVGIANALFQLKFNDATREVTRLFVNTTIGIGGLFDPAEKWGKVPAKNEDFGQTLGFYGVGHGAYFVLPLLGPSSFRDTGGFFVDTSLDPLSYIGDNLRTSEYLGVKSLVLVNRLSLDDDSYEKIKRDSLDPYLFIRAAYAQYRLAKVKE